jgi:hypothetical protein
MQTIREFLHRLFTKKPALRRIPGRFKVRDAAGSVITYRMNGLIPGGVTRTHPQWIVPYTFDNTNGPFVYGAPVKVNAAGNAVERYANGDAPTSIFGVIVRPFPSQPFVVSADGTQTNPMPVVDVMRSGYIGVKVTGVGLIDGACGLSATDATVFNAALATLNNCRLNGPSDAQGYAELLVSIPAAR